MAWWGEQTRNDGTNEVIEMFEDENPHITIETEYASWDDYWRKLAPQASANELPDIIQMDLAYISQYANNDQLTDLTRSEEHTSELQSRGHLVCRLLLEKKKKKKTQIKLLQIQKT